jgi:hypothetical protein
LCVWGYFEKLFISGNSWISLFVAAVVFGGIGIVITTIIVLNKQERVYFLNLVKSKIKR